jgi:acyl carrier protein
MSAVDRPMYTGMNIDEVVLAYLGEQIAPGYSINLDTNLTGIIDSTGVMELVVWVESTFKLSVELESVTPENFGGARQIADFVRRSLVRPPVIC